MAPLILSKVKNDLMSLKQLEYDGDEGGFRANRIPLRAKTVGNSKNFCLPAGIVKSEQG